MSDEQTRIASARALGRLIGLERIMTNNHKAGLNGTQGYLQHIRSTIELLEAGLDVTPSEPMTTFDSREKYGEEKP